MENKYRYNELLKFWTIKLINIMYQSLIATSQITQSVSIFQELSDKLKYNIKYM